MTRKTLLTACSAIASDTLVSDGKLVDWVQLMPMGVSKPRNGNPASFFLEDRKHADKVALASSAHWGSADMMLDYDHQALRAPAVAGQAPAAGWFKKIEARDDGIWGQVELTGQASAQVLDKQYRYLSPAFNYSPDGRVSRIINVALTNTPNLDMTALASALDSQEEDDTMNLTAIATALGLKPDASEADVLAAATKAGVTSSALTATASALNVEVGDDLTAIASAATALVDAAKTNKPDPAKFVPMDTVKELQGEASALKARLDAADAKERTALMDAAQADGRLTPALRKHFETAFTELTALAAALGDLPATGLSTKTVGAQGAKFSGDALTPDQVALCSSMGWDQAAYLEQLKSEAA